MLAALQTLLYLRQSQIQEVSVDQSLHHIKIWIVDFPVVASHLLPKEHCFSSLHLAEGNEGRWQLDQVCASEDSFACHAKNRSGYIPPQQRQRETVSEQLPVNLTVFPPLSPMS